MKLFASNTQWMPAEIGNFTIIERIGQGGMGDIYKAVQRSLNRTVALKVLSPQMGRSEEFSRRFVIEAKAISMLQHQNIVSIYEFGEEDGLKYFSMQYIDGFDLGMLLAEKRTLQYSEILSYSKQICRALRYAHSKNIIHRDIKPQNVLIDKNDTCRISDFGIAKIFAEANITMTGMAVGTPEYMSPEQAEGEKLDTQTDIYSLGVVIYEMVTKKPPFTGNNPVAIAYKQVHEFPIPPSALRKDVPKRLELIILKALKKNKMERYKTVEGMLRDLDTVDIKELNDAITLALTNQKEKSIKDTDTNRRITDRRTHSRRKAEYGNAVPIFTIHFWVNLLRTQGLSLLLIIILFILYFLHLDSHHW